MAEEVKISLKVDDNGTLGIFDQAGRKLTEMASTADRAGGQFGKVGASIISLNQALDLMQRGFQYAKQAADALILGPLAQADRIGKLAIQVGTTSEALSRLATSARLGDVDMEQLGQTMQKLNKEMAEGNPILAKLGVTSTDATEALLQLSDVFAQSENGSKKAAVAQELFGRSGREMIAWLNQGSAALREQMGLADQYGTVVGDDLAKKADAFNDKLDVLSMRFEGVALTIANDMMPAAEMVIDWMDRAMQKGGALKTTLDAIAGAADWMTGGTEAANAANAERSQDALWDAQRRRQRQVYRDAGIDIPEPMTHLSEGFVGPVKPTSGLPDNLFDKQKELTNATREYADLTQQIEETLRRMHGAIDDRAEKEQTSLDIEEASLEAALARNLTLEEEMQIAVALDDVQRRRYDAEIAALDLHIRQGDLSIEEEENIKEQIRLLEKKKDLIAGIGNEAARQNEAQRRADEEQRRSNEALYRGFLGFTRGENLSGALRGLAGGLGGGVNLGSGFSKMGTEGNRGFGVESGFMSAGGGMSGAGYAALVAAGINGTVAALDTYKNDKWQVGMTTDELVGNMSGQFLAGALSTFGIGGDGLGKMFSSLINSNGFMGEFGASLLSPGTPGMAKDILGMIFQAPTRGTQIRKEVSGTYRDASLPDPTWLEEGGYQGVRASKMDYFASDADIEIARSLGYDVRTNRRGGLDIFDAQGHRTDGYDTTLDRMRRGEEGHGIYREIAPGLTPTREIAGSAYGVAAAVSDNEGDTIGVGNQLINTIAALGVSTEEGKRILREFANEAGVNFGGAIEGMNKRLIEGEMSVDQFNSALTGLSDLFLEDLPAGVDVAAIASRNFTETLAGRPYMNLADFNKELEKQVELFGQIQDTMGGGIGDAIAAIFAGQAGDASQALKDSIYDSVLTGVTTGLVDGLQEMPVYEALQTNIGNFVNDIVARAMGTGELTGTSLNDVMSSFDAFLVAAGPAFEQLIALSEDLNDRLRVSATGQNRFADTLTADIKALEYQSLAPIDRLGFLRQDLANKRSIMDATEDPIERARLAEEVRTGALALAQEGSSRYGAGSAMGRAVNAEAIAVLNDLRAQATIAEMQLRVEEQMRDYLKMIYERQPDGTYVIINANGAPGGAPMTQAEFDALVVRSMQNPVVRQIVTRNSAGM